MKSKFLQAAAIVVATLSAPFAAQATEQTEQDAIANPQTWRAVSPDRLIYMKTTKGDILIEVAPEVAPNHVAQVLKIVRSGQYDGTKFHRVIEGFMAQGGDISAARPDAASWDRINAEFSFRRAPEAVRVVPLDADATNDGVYGGYLNGFPVVTRQPAQADYAFDGRVEAWMPHCPGVTSMARTNDPNSATDQFFLMRDTSEFLDLKYSSWGRMVSGLDVAQSLNVGEPPSNPDILIFARVASDLAEDARPRAYVMRNESQAFADILSTSDAEEICNAPETPAIVVMP